MAGNLHKKLPTHRQRPNNNDPEVLVVYVIYIKKVAGDEIQERKHCQRARSVSQTACDGTCVRLGLGLPFPTYKSRSHDARLEDQRCHRVTVAVDGEAALLI